MGGGFLSGIEKVLDAAVCEGNSDYLPGHEDSSILVSLKEV